MLKAAIIVGLGGFIGSVSRYLSSHFIHKYFETNFPLGTVFVNLAGCFLIGIFFGLFEKGHIISPEMRLFLTVGLCGGFTTFSSFTNDSMNLANEAEIMKLSLYIGISVVAGIYMTMLGRNLVNYINV